MRYLLLTIAALLLASPATAAGLMIIKSQHKPAYDQAVRLLQKSCARGAETLTMSDYADFDLSRIVREEQPRLVFAVGETALKEARRLRRTPVVYSMTLDSGKASARDNITGVTMFVAPELYLKLFRKLQLHRVAVIYDPKRSGAYLQRARKAAAGFGIELITREVDSPRMVASVLAELKSSAAEGIWMLPDSTAVTPENVDAYFHAGQQQHLPVISFARGYLDRGALAVLEISRETIAELSCSQAGKILAGADMAELNDMDVNQAELFTNESVASRFQIDPATIKQISTLF